MTEEISVVNKQQVHYLGAPPPPLCHLTFDLVEEILCRLSVKSLLQFRRVCKSWNTLISHPRFAKKHFNMPSITVTTTRHHLYCLNSTDPSLRLNTITCCPVNSTMSTVFKKRNSTLSTKVTNFKYPSNILAGGPVYCRAKIVGSLNGILCIAQDRKVMLWNPSINKFKKLPPIEDLRNSNMRVVYGFGYDRATDNYKVVSVLYTSTIDLFKKPQVRVNTLGTNFWENIQNFPFDSTPDAFVSGKFVSGTINWLASKHWSPEGLCFIVSLDLGNYSYQKILSPPDCEQKHSLSVLRDCLCMVSGHDIWIMKEYGNKESWTKLYTVSYLRDPSKFEYLSKALYTFDDDQVLLESAGEWGLMFVVYDPKINTFKFIKFEDNENGVYNPIYDREPEIYIESLIWPCSE